MTGPRLVVVDGPAPNIRTVSTEGIWTLDRGINSQSSFRPRVDCVGKPSSGIERLLYDARILDAYAIGVQAYVWGWPIVEAARIRANMLDPAFKYFAPINGFRHEVSPADADFTLFPAPCTDLIYSEVFFDVTAEPMVVHVPDMRSVRYWTLQITNFFTETLANLSKRTVGNGPGNYALVGPRWNGELPPGMVRVDVDQNVGFALLQIVFEDGEDLVERARPIQQRFKLTPLSCLEPLAVWRAKTVPVTDWRRRLRGTNDLHTSLLFFQALNTAWKEAGIRAEEKALIALFNRIGVGPNLEFDPARLDVATREALGKAVNDGWSLVRARSATIQKGLVDGWTTSNESPAGAWSFDSLQRAGCAHHGIFSNIAAECAVIATTVEDCGASLSGERKFTLHIDRQRLPKVDAYWSLNAYTLPGRQLFATSAPRSAISSFDKNLTYNADGSLDIQIQNAKPGADSEQNWLPVPEGPFELVMRMYQPNDPAIFLGAYAPGAVTQVSSHAM